MILVGRNLSPYTRRVAISLDLMEMPFERREYATATDVEQIRAINPMGRVPALVLDDGEVLVESGAILDHLDEMAGPGLRLTPAGGADRRQVLKLSAYATGAMDKAVVAYYEETRRPEDKQWPDYADRADAQVLAALEVLDAACLAAGGDGPVVGGRLSQADVSATVALDFVRRVRPGLVAADAVPALQALAERCNALPSFAKTRP